MPPPPWAAGGRAGAARRAGGGGGPGRPLDAPSPGGLRPRARPGAARRRRLSRDGWGLVTGRVGEWWAPSLIPLHWRELGWYFPTDTPQDIDKLGSTIVGVGEWEIRARPEAGHLPPPPPIPGRSSLPCRPAPSSDSSRYPTMGSVGGWMGGREPQWPRRDVVSSVISHPTCNTDGRKLWEEVSYTHTKVLSPHYRCS